MFRPGHVTHWNRARENVCVRLSRGAIDILQPAIFDRRWWKATPSIEHLGQWCISLRRNSRREASRWEIYLSLATGGGCHGDASRRIRLPLLLFVKMKTCGIRLLQLIYWSACQTPRNDFSFFLFQTSWLGGRFDLNAQIRTPDWLPFLSDIQINGNEWNVFVNYG